MMTAHPSSVFQKRDLHVGGLGSRPSVHLAAIAEPAREARDAWVEKAREAIESADDYIHNNPWQALAVVALAGLAAGYFLSRRS